MKRIIMIILLISGLILISGCDAEKKTEAKKLIPVMTYQTHLEEISSYIKLTGGLEAGTDLDLYSMSSEKIKEIYVKEGDRVEKGTLLLEQENEIARQGVRLGLAGVNSARSQLELAAKEYSRMEQLLEEKAVTQQQFDQIKMQKNSAEAGLELAEAQLEQVKKQLEYTRIYAPFSGEIAMLYFREGQMVAAGVPVVKLVNSQKMTARLQASELDYQALYVGQSVEARFPALPDSVYMGKVISIDKAIDPHSRTLELTVELSETDLLRSGMFGEFLLVTKQHKDVIVLSDEAVMTRTKILIDKNGKQTTEKEYYVFLEKGKEAVLQTVKTGIHSKGRLEITDGLKTGDQVIVVGQNIVKAGDKVKVIN